MQKALYAVYAVSVIAIIIALGMFAYTDKPTWLYIAMVAVPALALERKFDDWNLEPITEGEI